MEVFGSYLIPILIALILLFGFLRKVPLFDTFLEGAKEGMKSTVSIAPALIGLITAVTMLKASGALDLFTAAIRPAAAFSGISAGSDAADLIASRFRERFHRHFGSDFRHMRA